MGKSGSKRFGRYAPLVIGVTIWVVLCPALLVLWLRWSGVIPQSLLAVALGAIFSLGASWLGSRLWQRHTGSEDVLFTELLLWGFVRRRRAERRIESARKLLADGHRGSPSSLQVRDLTRLVAALETADPYSSGHSRRVARHAWMIAREMGLPREEVAGVRVAAALHDVGKVETPTAVLRKPGALSDAEFDVIKRHPVDGEAMIASLGDSRLSEAVRHHHERLDGSGYPDGRRGDQIPIGARIIAVADTFDAITSARPYRPARSHRQALEILHREAGRQLDAGVVHAFEQHYGGRRRTLRWSMLANLPTELLGSPGTSLAPAVGATKLATAAIVLAGVTAAATVAGRSHPARADRTRPVVALALPRATTLRANRAAPALSRVAISHAPRLAHSRPSIKHHEARQGQTPAPWQIELPPAPRRSPSNVGSVPRSSVPAPPRASGFVPVPAPAPAPAPAPPPATPPALPTLPTTPAMPVGPPASPTETGIPIVSPLLQFALQTVHALVCHIEPCGSGPGVIPSGLDANMRS